MTELTATQRISNQIKNNEALSKIVRPTGMSQEYTPVINLTQLGSELLNNPTVFLKSKELGYEIISGQSEIKMVYSKMGSVDDYNKECFTDLHAKITNDYKEVMSLVVKQAVEDGLVQEDEGNILKTQIENVQKPVYRREDDKVRVKAKLK